MSTFAPASWWRILPSQLLEKIAIHSFDARHGTDTSTFAALDGLAIASDNKRHGERYQPSPVHSLRQVLRRLAIRHADFSFVDFGSGKGRALLIAGELPFRRVIGVEFSAELHGRAEQNIVRYRRRAASEVAAVHADATQFKLPAGDLVLYFFNPFAHAVLHQVLTNINAALRTQSRKVILIYLYLPDEAWLAPLYGFRLREYWHKYYIFEYTPTPTSACSLAP
jgi:SAM-dependent methyltransferase